jgi:hypothetical protein
MSGGERVITFLRRLQGKHKQPPRIMDRSEARRRWRRRQIAVGIVVVLGAFWMMLWIVSAVDDRAIAFVATVDSEQCGKAGCTVGVHYTQPNGEAYTDEFSAVSPGRVHLGADRRTMTLYWFAATDDVDTYSDFWGDVAAGAVSLPVLTFVILMMVADGWDMRVQARARGDAWAPAR